MLPGARLEHKDSRYIVSINNGFALPCALDLDRIIHSILKILSSEFKMIFMAG